MTSIGALMDRRVSIMNKTISIFIVCSFIFGFNVLAFDNLVENGTFDSDLENWDTINSPNFLINVTNEQAQINGNGVSLWWDTNSDFDDGSLNNLEKIDCEEFYIEGEKISSYLTLGHTTSNLIINPTFENDGYWNYSKFGNREDYINASINNETLSYDVNSTSPIVSLRDSFAGVIINQTINTTTNGFLEAEISYKHDFFNISGEINSSMVLETNIGNYTVFDEKTETNTNWTTENYSGSYLTTGTEINVTLNTTHDIHYKVGDIQITKTTKWDNCYVNISSYYQNGNYISSVINATQKCSWSQLATYTSFNPSLIDEKHIVYFRNGDVENPDGTWTNWIDIGNPYSTTYFDGVYKNIYNITGFTNYSQYKIEWLDVFVESRPNNFYGSVINGVLNEDNLGIATISQTISKPYTNYTVLNYDQQVLTEDILGGNITVSFGDYVVDSYNITDLNNSVNSYSFVLPESINPMGVYDLNFTVNTIFATPNETLVRIPTDVVFALDNSGSMSVDDMISLKTATKDLIGILSEEDRVAIFIYDGGDSEVVRPELLREYAYMSSANKTSFNSSVDSIVDGGFTPFYDTVGDAINYTQINKIDGRLEFVLAMTDGESNSDDYWTPEAEWGNTTTSDPNNYDSDDWMQSSGGLKGILKAPCMVYTVGLGITHDLTYPTAPEWSQTAPEPSTGIEYDVWNVANSSPYPLSSEGGKYGKNETGVNNIGHYYFTEDSSDLPEIFQEIYVDVYLTEVSGINCSCVVNIDNVEVLIIPQAPVVVSFYVRDSTPVSFDFYGTFTDYTLNEEYDFDTEGIKSVNIIVADTYNLTVTDITHLGSGVYEFEYVWSYPPVALNDTTLMDTYAIVIDKTGNVGIDYVSIARPTVLSVLIYIGCIFLFVFIILTICRLIKKAFVMEKLIK